MIKSPEETRAYNLWYSLSSRVGVDKNYIDCENLFNDIQAFTDWCLREKHFMAVSSNGDYWNLDKDIISPYNRNYSPDKCCFVPQEINKLFMNANSGEFMRGVYKVKGHKHKYGSAMQYKGKRLRFGYFDDELAAHQAWQAGFINKIREIVNENVFDFDDKVLTGMLKHAALVELSLNNGIVTTNTFRI